MAGTPNKEKPLKTFLREHSLRYFTPVIAPEDANIEDGPRRAEFILLHQGELVSLYDIDLYKMKPADRAKAEQDLLAYHTPKMQAAAIDMAVNEGNMTIRERLDQLAKSGEINEEES